jgi:hypothetical protein
MARKTLPTTMTQTRKRSGSMATSDPTSPGDERGRVLRFRPRGSVLQRHWTWPPAAESETPVDDLAKYERADHTDDYRHRMTMNVLALAVTLILIGTGIWLTNKLVQIRDEQDCYLSGRRNCFPIEVPSHRAP